MDQFGYARRLVVGDGQLRVFEGEARMNRPRRTRHVRPIRSSSATCRWCRPNSIAGRALVIVIAIMTFLACLTAGGAILVSAAPRSLARRRARATSPSRSSRARARTSRRWSPRPPRSPRARPGVADAVAYTKAQSEAMLAPWLGDGVDLGQLPIPRLIVVHMQPGHREDLDALRAALAAGTPQASLDDHRLWLTRLDTMADAIVVFAGALFALMIVAMATAVGFATRGAMAGGARDHRGAAFRRRRRFLYRRPVPGPFPALGAQRRPGSAAARRRCSSPWRRSLRCVVAALGGRRRDRRAVRRLPARPAGLRRDRRRRRRDRVSHRAPVAADRLPPAPRCCYERRRSRPRNRPSCSRCARSPTTSPSTSTSSC